jgi:transcriptional regulator with XRE-family HTH domain
MRRTIHAKTENPVVERITEMLIRTGKSQKELTDYLGVDKATYSDWKNGKTSSYKRYIDKIAEFLDSSYDYILDGKEADPDEMELLRLYRNLTKEKKSQLLLVAQTI